jgi:hypothetical protein
MTWVRIKFFPSEILTINPLQYSKFDWVNILIYVRIRTDRVECTVSLHVPLATWESGICEFSVGIHACFRFAGLGPCFHSSMHMCDARNYYSVPTVSMFDWSSFACMVVFDDQVAGGRVGNRLLNKTNTLLSCNSFCMQTFWVPSGPVHRFWRP